MATMEILTFVLLVGLSYMSVISAETFNVVNNGAVGNGKTDDTQAFLKTWSLFCTAGGNPIFLVPSGKTFLLKKIEFQGPCKSKNLYFQVWGEIVAPNYIWRPASETSSWIYFENVDGLTVNGRGSIDGKGDPWWDCKANHKCGMLPNTIGVYGCNNFRIGYGLTLKYSPGKHLTFSGSNYVTIDGINIISPEASPNTDGIYTQDTQHVNIQNSLITTGDDCVAIGMGSMDVNVTNINCGPGHGISIGSLGAGGIRSTVEQVRVTSCNFTRAQNGVRIKTWQGGSGYARKVVFQNINFHIVDNPIIIDQYYCNGLRSSCQNKTSAVQISDVQFIGMRGSTSGEVAINLACSLSVGCHGVYMDNINLWSVKPNTKASSYCLNVHGSSRRNVSPPVPCLG